MKALLKNFLSSIPVILLYISANGQLYSYDKTKKTETDPNEVSRLINIVAPAKAVPLALPVAPFPGSIENQQALLAAYLNNDAVNIEALRTTLKGSSGLSDDEKKLLFFLEKKTADGRKFFPVRNITQAQAYYENSDELDLADEDGFFSLEHAYLNYLSQSKKIAAYSEIGHDYFGPVRISAGLLGLAPSSKDSGFTTKQSDSIYNKKLFQERFKSGGGNVIFNFSYSLLHLHDKDSKYFDLKVYASPRFSIDIPKEDTNVQRFAHHTQLGGEVQLKVTSFEKVFTFLLCWRGFQAWGNSTFYDNMGFVNKDRKSFNFNTWTTGVIIKKNLQFFYTWYSGDSRAVNQISAKNNNSITANYQF